MSLSNIFLNGKWNDGKWNQCDFLFEVFSKPHLIQNNENHKNCNINKILGRLIHGLMIHVTIPRLNVNMYFFPFTRWVVPLSSPFWNFVNKIVACDKKWITHNMISFDFSFPKTSNSLFINCNKKKSKKKQRQNIIKATSITYCVYESKYYYYINRNPYLSMST